MPNLGLLCLVVIIVFVIGVSGFDSDEVMGNIFAEVLSTEDQHIFNLNPKTVECNAFLFAFKQFDITGSAQLQMYDDGISAPFFTCVACGDIVPPVFYSTTGKVKIQINGVNGAGFNPSHFELQYVGFIADHDDESIMVPKHTDFELELKMPYGHIKPVLMGGKYIAGWSRQKWAISVSAAKIKFYLGLIDFTAAADGGCGATLTIYDGLSTSSPVLFSGCNANSNPEEFIFTSSGRALVVLDSLSTQPLEIDFLLDYISDAELYGCGSVTTPDVLESNSMTITDGSKSNKLMRRGESCEWHIMPLSESRITLLMNWVSLKPGARVVVYDNSEDSGVVLWDSAGTFTTVPPPLTSSRNSLYVVYTGNSQLATGYFGFNGDYYSRRADSAGIGSKQELYSMSSAIGISLPDMETGKYRVSSSYSFLLKPLQSTGSLYVVINVLNISDCDDSIRVYDGTSNTSPLLQTLCGSSAPIKWIEATSGSALLEFSSDSDQERSGQFDFSFFSDGTNYHCGFPTNPAVLISQSMTLTDGSSSTESLYGSQYCEWVIEPDNSHGLVLYFERLDLRGGGALKVYDGDGVDAPKLLDISSVAAIPVMISSILSNKMKIVYSSASQPEGSQPAGMGFSATYFNINEDVSGPGLDDIIKLYSSSSNSFTLPIPAQGHFPFANNYTFLIRPPALNGSLYIQVLNISITDCDESLEIYSEDKTELLMKFTCDHSDSHIEKLTGFWLEVAKGSAIVEFHSPPPPYGVESNLKLARYTFSNFDIAYFSEGPSQHCGVKSNPAILSASSMPFSDGSGYDQQMHGGDVCEWLIKNPYDDEGDEISNYVIEFSSNDLRGGGQLYVYDGSSDKDNLLWSCRDCNEIPQSLVTSSDVAFIRYVSPPEANINDELVWIGDGFHANYWAIKKSNGTTIDVTTDDYKLMSLPVGYTFHSDTMPNETDGWLLGISDEESSLFFAPSYSYESVDTFNNTVKDLTYLDYSAKKDKPPAASCGFVQSSQPTTLQTSNFRAAANQWTRAVANTISSKKRILEISESYDASSFNHENLTVDKNPVIAASSCTYVIDTGASMQSASIWVKGLNTRVSGRLRVYGGVYGHDAELFNEAGTVNGFIGFFLPCGRGTIMLDSNMNGTELSTDSPLDYYFEMTYKLTPGDHGTDCARYIEFLYGGEKKENFFVQYSSAFILLFFLAIVFCICVSCPEKIPRSWKDMYRRQVSDIKNRYKVARAPRPHPPFSPQIDGFRNKYLLRKGECCVCKVNTEKVLKLKGCQHAICLEDLNGYICTALGDVSMFPLKCPLHIDGCLSTITPHDAKRVLLEPQYDKFLEFTDRGLYGEGMRCIFCANYVKFPAETKLDQMRCRKCYQCFCIRCKGPWHYGRRCVVDAIDDTLESWKVASGAQKCPGCSKLIEKDDPSTCHHMIHKISDGIPCCRERTDFCYLCGMEVQGDYPHDEVKNPGVNHFPEGVFQRCRTIINKERDIEREFLRRARRRNARSLARVQPVVFEDGSFGGIDGGTVDLAAETAVVTNDPFDVMWGDSPVRDRINAEFSEYA